jgi:aspartyl/asparaginyl beta-hydroxylase (cupin superfamily)
MIVNKFMELILDQVWGQVMWMKLKIPVKKKHQGNTRYQELQKLKKDWKKIQKFLFQLELIQKVKLKKIEVLMGQAV